MSTTCLTITMPGIAPYYLWPIWSDPANLHNPPTTPWENRPSNNTQENHLTAVSYLKPAGYPSNCAQLAIAVPTVPHPSLPACIVDTTRAAVFVTKTKETVTETCLSHGYQPWTS
jgi:hypothetical protein